MAGSLSEVQLPSTHELGRVFELEAQSEGTGELQSETKNFQDKAGGYFYKHNPRFSRTTRNRHITWSVFIYIGLGPLFLLFTYYLGLLQL